MSRPNLTGHLLVDLRALLLGLCVLVLTACGGPRQLMPAPNLYQGSDAPVLFDSLPESLQSSEARLVFVTDRAPEQDEEGRLTYGYRRSQSLAFGTATVKIEPDMPWDELVRISLQEERSEKLTLRLDSLEEAHRLPRTPMPVKVVDNQVELYPEVAKAMSESAVAFSDYLIERLSTAPRKEVVVYVHGFNNQFADAAETLAELWHFSGREFVPILYTWPAGRGGLKGYTYDRESGEFTIYHLKQLIELLSYTPEIEKVHLLAHSRGTDVLSSAIREVMLASRARGEDPVETYRVANLVLAAPDLDADVVSQRMIAEYIGTTVGEVTIYTSESDRAVGAARSLFDSRERIGTLTIDDIPEADRDILSGVSGVTFVELEGRTDSTGHGYFHSSPEASSDLIMTLRYGLQAGDDDGRPLEHLGAMFWRIEPGYPNQTR